MKEQIRQAFSSLHASDETLKEVLQVIDRRESQKAKGRRLRPVSAVLAVVLVFSTLAMTGFAADYILNGREVFFFDTIAALTEQQQADRPGEAVRLEVPGTLEENLSLESPQGYVARAMEEGLREQETVLLTEEDEDPATLWEKRKVSQQEHDRYGGITSEYLVGKAFAERLVIEGLGELDVSCIGEVLTPTENAQLVVTERSRESGELVMAEAVLGFHDRKGDIFSFYLGYDRDDRFAAAQYVLDSAYDSSELYRTADGVEVLINAYDGQVWVNAQSKGMTVSIYTAACGTDQVKALLDALELSRVLM